MATLPGSIVGYDGRAKEVSVVVDDSVLAAMMDQVRSHENVHGARIRLGKAEPSTNDLLQQWINFGGLTKFLNDRERELEIRRASNGSH